MSIFKCATCGAAENTAASSYWSQVDKGKKPECSECLSGEWHGLFPKRTIEEEGYVKLKSGFYGPADGSWGEVK